jgi:hypothetical protein
VQAYESSRPSAAARVFIVNISNAALTAIDNKTFQLGAQPSASWFLAKLVYNLGIGDRDLSTLLKLGNQACHLGISIGLLMLLEQ